MTLTIQSMDDIYRLANRQLDAHGLRMKPRPITMAHGPPINMFLVDVGALTKFLYEDAATAHVQTRRGCLEPFGVQSAASRRTHGNILASDWYAEASAKAPPSSSLFVYSLFKDGTVRQSSGAKYCPVILYNNHLPLAVRYRTDNIIFAGFVPYYRPRVELDGSRKDGPRTTQSLCEAATGRDQ